MEKGKNISYEAISDNIRKLYTDVRNFNQKRIGIANSFKQFSNYVADKKFSHPFPTIEAEINDVIGKWNPKNSLEQLTDRLKIYFEKIAAVDVSISEIQKKHHKLLQVPDRHNRKNVTDKVDIFLKNVHTTTLSQIDKVKDDIIPKIHQMMNEVQKGFRNENNKIKENEQNATSLLSRIESYKAFVDKFGLYQTCTQAKKIADEILQKPNYSNPDADKVKLQKANSALDVCDAAFKDESDAFAAIGSNLYKSKHLMWLDDHDRIYQIVKEGATHNICSASKLQALYSDAVKLKKKDFSQLLSGYDEKIKSFFQSDIDYINNNCVDRQEMQKLRAKFDKKMDDDKKQLYYNIAKAVAALVALCVFVWLMVAYWPISGIVLAIIVAIGLFVIFKS